MMFFLVCFTSVSANFLHVADVSGTWQILASEKIQSHPPIHSMMYLQGVTQTRESTSGGLTFRSFTKNLPHSPLGRIAPEQSGGVRASNSPKTNLMPPKKGRGTLRAVQLYSCAQNRPSAASETPGRAHPGASGPFPPATHTLGTLWPAGLAGGDLWWPPAAVPQVKDAISV